MIFRNELYFTQKLSLHGIIEIVYHTQNRNYLFISKPAERIDLKSIVGISTGNITQTNGIHTSPSSRHLYQFIILQLLKAKNLPHAYSHVPEISSQSKASPEPATKMSTSGNAHKFFAHSLNKHELLVHILNKLVWPNHFPFNHRLPEQSKLTDKLDPSHVIAINQMRTLQAELNVDWGLKASPILGIGVHN